MLHNQKALLTLGSYCQVSYITYFLLRTVLLLMNMSIYIVDFHLIFLVEQSFAIDDVIIEGIVPRFVEFLERHDLPQLQV